MQRARLPLARHRHATAAQPDWIRQQRAEPIVRRWLRSGSGPEAVRKRSGRGPAAVWPRSGSGLAAVWPRSGSPVGYGLQRRCGATAAAHRAGGLPERACAREAPPLQAIRSTGQAGVAGGSS